MKLKSAMLHPTRRSFMKYAALAAAGNSAGLQPFGTLAALAQGAGDYKALVCVFLYGGNDANNMLVPFDAAGYSAYAGIRGPLALQQNALLQLGALPDFSLNGNMPEVATLFDSSKVALLANVGTLIQSTSRQQFLAGGTLPDNLFSHTDQQREWQNASQSGGNASGWAGRISDVLGGVYNSNCQIPMIASVSGDTLFCDGQSTRPVSITPGNVGGSQCYETKQECLAEQTLAQSLLTLDSGLSLVQADQAIIKNANVYANVLSSAVADAPALQTVFPAGNTLAAQLQQAAKIIQVRAALGAQRQIFFASIGNFDTHANQLIVQNGLLAEVSSAMSAFYAATAELGVSENVTTFTMSEFSRAFQPNSNTGSDHAWGSHHLVMGGAVKGGQMYGSFPTLALGGPSDSGGNGRWLPTTSSVQYAATLASWFGVSAAQLPLVLPTLTNFPGASLGFL